MPGYAEKRGVWYTITHGVSESEAAAAVEQGTQIAQQGAEAASNIVNNVTGLIKNWQLILLGGLALIILLKK